MTKEELSMMFHYRLISVLLLFLLYGEAISLNNAEHDPSEWLLVRKESRKSVVRTENGEVSAVDILAGKKSTYHLQFITLEPNSLFLPVLLHADMTLYVQTGNGKLEWTDDGKHMESVNLRKGDVFRLRPGSIFFIRSSLDTEREKLRIFAIFSNADEDFYDSSVGAYSSIRNLVVGFDGKLLQSAFKVSADVIHQMLNTKSPPGVVHGEQTKESRFWKLEGSLLSLLDDVDSMMNRHKKDKLFNVFEAEPDFKNCNGWSLTVDKGNMKQLKGSNVGIFMVNMTRGSMMGPHWNPMATEIGVVLQGQGMVRVVCSGGDKESECKSGAFRVGEGDVFAVPRFFPVAQMSFDNDSFVFMGFSSTSKKNHPQFLAGKRSIFQSMDRRIVGRSFNVNNVTVVDRLLSAQEESVILECVFCAEVEERKLEEEIKREKEKEEQEEREREEEERAREEQERERKREEEEEERAREEQERERKREEEEEEERAREEQERERKREEEEERAREEQERERKREEEEERARKEEEAREREREEEEERAREEEETRERQEREREKKRKEEEERAGEEEEAREREREQEEEERAREAEEEAREREEEERSREEEEKEARAREEGAERGIA